MLDFGARPATIVRTADFGAPRPMQIIGAMTIATRRLRDLMGASPQLLRIDGIGGNQTTNLPGAIRLCDAGLGNGLHDQTQDRLGTN